MATCRFVLSCTLIFQSLLLPLGTYFTVLYFCQDKQLPAWVTYWKLSDITSEAILARQNTTRIFKVILNKNSLSQFRNSNLINYQEIFKESCLYLGGHARFLLCAGKRKKRNMLVLCSFKISDFITSRKFMYCSCFSNLS